MQRYEGLLRPHSRSAPYPTRWVFVSCTGRPLPVDGRVSLRRTGLQQWDALILSCGSQLPIRQEEVAGQTPGGLWTLLADLSSRSGLTWVMSPRALFDWTLAGLWERLLLGTISVHNRSPRRAGIAPDRGMGRAPGFLSAADPPSAAVLLLSAAARPLTWVCAGNYGWRDACLNRSGPAACQQLAKAVVEASDALKRHRLGGWCMTLGSMAMRAWRSNHMTECLYVDKDERVAELLRSANVGARLFAASSNAVRYPCFWADARGHYCHIGATDLVPTGLRCCGDDFPLQTVRSCARASQLVARVRLREAGGRFPVRRDQDVIYPSGRYKTVLCGPELTAAIKGGYVDEAFEWSEFNIGRPLASFERACWDMRTEAEGGAEPHTATLAKALAVSLIGKLHAYDQVWEEVEPDYNDPICGSWQGPDGQGDLTEYRALGGQVSRLRRAGLAATAVPAIPLWIWSYSRNWIWERMSCAGLTEVLYVDTDGLVVTALGWDRLIKAGYIHDNRWGELRYLAGPVEVDIRGPKMVRIGDELICAGRPKDQRQSQFIEEGYWFRAPLEGGAGQWAEGVWEEVYRER